LRANACIQTLLGEPSGKTGEKLRKREGKTEFVGERKEGGWGWLPLSGDFLPCGKFELHAS